MIFWEAALVTACTQRNPFCRSQNKLLCEAFLSDTFPHITLLRSILGFSHLPNPTSIPAWTTPALSYGNIILSIFCKIYSDRSPLQRCYMTCPINTQGGVYVCVCVIGANANFNLVPHWKWHMSIARYDLQIFPSQISWQSNESAYLDMKLIWSHVLRLMERSVCRGGVFRNMHSHDDAHRLRM